jgi:hypothetical protein
MGDRENEAVPAFTALAALLRSLQSPFYGDCRDRSYSGCRPPGYSPRNDGQEPPSLPQAKGHSNCKNLHSSSILSTQFLHSQIMSIFIKKYQHNTELPSFVQGDRN